MNKTQIMKILLSLTPTDISEIKNNIATLQLNKAEKTYVDEKFQQANSAFKIRGTVATVELLPDPKVDESINTGDIYLIGTENTENKEEYVLLADRTWEKLGSVVNVDLSSYITSAEITALLATELAKKANVDAEGKVEKAKNADKVNGLTVESAVPAGAKFTDTLYNDSEIRQLITNLENTSTLNTIVVSDTMFTEFVEDGISLYSAAISNTFGTDKLLCILNVNGKEEFCDIETTTTEITITTLSPVVGTLYVIS